MGAWAHGSFDNDDALDWAGDCVEADGTAPVAEAFAAVLDAGEYIEAPEASAAVAAAEVVAALLGRPAGGLPDTLSAWVAGRKPPRPGLVKQAEKAVRLVLAGSELKDLWAESGDAGKWQAGVEDLLRRLATPAA